MKTQQWRPSARLRKRRVPQLSIIDVSGLAAVMFFLVAMFMTMVSQYHHIQRDSVELAQAKRSSLQPGARKEDAINIRVNRDDNFYFDSKRVTPEQIPELIRAAVQQGSEAKVYLGIDARTNYGSVKVMLDEIRIAKIENVALLTD
jgi:biopolymer transport protein ExbD